MSMTKYVAVDTKVELLYIDNEHPDDCENTIWCKGKVKKVRKHATEYTSGDIYVEVDILFNDGEYVKNVRLYDSDFGTNEYGAWRFYDNKMQKIVTDMYQKLKEIEELEDLREDPDYQDSDDEEEYEDSDDDEDDSDNSDNNDEEDTDEDYTDEDYTDEDDDDNNNEINTLKCKLRTVSMWNVMSSFAFTVVAMMFVFHIYNDDCEKLTPKPYVCRLFRF